MRAGQGNGEWNVSVPGAAELQRFQKLPVIGLFAQLYLERQSHFGLRVKPDGIVLDVQLEAIIASLFAIALGMPLEVKEAADVWLSTLRP